MFVYVLICCDGSLYTGYTRDLARRIQMHDDGRAAKYTRSRRPLRLAAWMHANDASHAKSVEARFKQLTRDQKLRALECGEAFGMRLHKP